MPSNADVVLGLKALMFASSPTYRVEWPNVTPDIFTLPYVAFDVVPVASEDGTLDGTDEMLSGFVSVLVVVDKGTSTEALNAILSHVKSVFYRGLRVTQGSTVVTFAEHLNVQRSYPDDVFYNTPATIRFTAS